MPPLHRIAVLALIALVAVPATGADAKKRRHRPALAVTRLVVPRTPLDPAKTFTLRGRVVNRSRHAKRPLISFTLRTKRRRGGAAYAIGGANVLHIRRRSSTRFRLRTRLSGAVPVVAGRRLYVRACVRRKRGARPRCRIARRRIEFIARPAPAGTPIPTPPLRPGPGGPEQPGGEGNTPASTFAPGARTLGDRLFPEIGNGGYDAQHYDLEIQYDPLTDVLLGRTVMRAQATQDLSQFSLDFHGLSISGLEVDGQAAQYTREGDKLIITPPAGIPNGATFTTETTYGGTATPYTDPDGSDEGWIPTGDGAFVVNEPVGAMSWFPCNNHPADKATYDEQITVPDAPNIVVFGNGRLVSSDSGTWRWRAVEPTATYLVTATNGVFMTSTDEADPDVPHYYGVDPASGGAAFTPTLERSSDIEAFYADMTGVPYPFDASGGVVDSAGNVGYSLESQTKPQYPLPVDITTIAHELAHQWWGDSVSPATWSDIWLNEGPAEFWTWLWDERENGGDTTEARFDDNYDSSSMSWSVAPAHPDSAEDLFDTDAMYTRGAMVMEALRQVMGEPAFLTLNREWLTRYAYDDASTADFIALVKEISGKDPARLDEFFQQWLYTSYSGDDKPTITPDNF